MQNLKLSRNLWKIQNQCKCIFQRVRDVYGADSVQYSYARKSLEALWQGLCKLADSDQDELMFVYWFTFKFTIFSIKNGKLIFTFVCVFCSSLDEWIDLLKKVDLRDCENEPKWFLDYQAFMFKLFDVSGKTLN